MTLYRQSLNSKFRLSPEFALAVLRGGTPQLGIQYVLESQQRDEATQFVCSGRSQHHIDPRSLPASALRPATVELLAAPAGCIFLFEFICLLDVKSVDPYGWQYNVSTGSTLASFPNPHGSSTTRDEGEEEAAATDPGVWTPSPSHRCTARRRVWFRAFSAASAASAAKKRLSDETIGLCRGGESLRGELWKEGNLNRSWKKRFCILTDRSLDYYSGQPSAINKHGSMSLLGCTVGKLYGSQCPGRDFGMLISPPEGGGGRKMLLDAYSERERADWIFHLSYVLALLAPGLGFSPLPSSPPFAARAEEEVLCRGDLGKLGHVIHNWNTRHVELTPTLLRYFDGPANKGSVLLLDACLVDLSDGQGKDGEFCLTSRAGYRLKMRASSKADKQRWLAAISAAIAQVAQPDPSAASAATLAPASPSPPASAPATNPHAGTSTSATTTPQARRHRFGVGTYLSLAAAWLALVAAYVYANHPELVSALFRRG